MHQMNLIRRAALILTVTTIAIAGCDSQDRRLAEYAQRATEQQARQNERMAQQSEAVARQSQELASAAHELVAQDAVARRELIQAQESLQQQIHVERSGVDRQREQVEIERKSVAKAAIREPLIAQAILAIGLIVAALLPLLVTALALWRLPSQTTADELLSEYLIDGFAVGQPVGIAPAPPRPSLPAVTGTYLGDPDEPPAAAGS